MSIKLYYLWNFLISLSKYVKNSHHLHCILKLITIHLGIISFDDWTSVLECSWTYTILSSDEASSYKRKTMVPTVVIHEIFKEHWTQITNANQATTECASILLQKFFFNYFLVNGLSRMYQYNQPWSTQSCKFCKLILQTELDTR